MTRKRLWLVFLQACAISLCLSESASAVVLEVDGEGRGAPFRAVCNDGFLVGFRGRVGAWIDNFKIVCESWKGGTRTDVDPQVGLSTGGGPAFGRCPFGSAVKSLHVVTTKGDGPTNVIHSVDFHCLSIADGRSTDRNFGSSLPPETRKTGLGIGTTFSTDFPTRRCPEKEVATGLHGRSGSFVDALGLICGPIPIAAPPTPAATNDPPKGPEQTRPPSSQDFTGTWDTKTDKGWGYTITLVQTGREVTGNYIAQDGSRGRIRGRFGAGIMEFDWDQDGGFTGSGQFALAPDANTFSGVYRANPNPKLTDPRLLQGVWNGTRR